MTEVPRMKPLHCRRRLQVLTICNNHISDDLRHPETSRTPDEIDVLQMSYLDSVSDFLITPVLRQARRLSGSATNNGTEAAGSEASSAGGRRGIDELRQSSQQSRGQIWQAMDGRPRLDSVNALPMSTSPIEENSGFEIAADGHGTPHVVPARLSSISSDYDGDVSDNPSFRSRLQMSSSSHTLQSTRSHSTIDMSMSRAENGSNYSHRDTSGSGWITRHRNSSLPADDGMGALRRHIISIQDMDVPGEQKARLMHQLLTQGYNEAQEAAQAKHQAEQQAQRETLPHLSSTIVNQERPTTPGSLSSFIWQMNGADHSPENKQHAFRLSPEDLERSYAPLDPTALDDPIEDLGSSIKATPVLGCRHYKRNVKLQCVTCEKWYTCRLCHDEAEDHVLIRNATKNMLCMLCGCAQKADEFCSECGERTAWYYCKICKLWDNDATKDIYHCNDCGICRKGRGIGKDFFHCKVRSSHYPVG